VSTLEGVIPVENLVGQEREEKREVKTRKRGESETDTCRQKSAKSEGSYETRARETFPEGICPQVNLKEGIDRRAAQNER